MCSLGVDLLGRLLSRISDEESKKVNSLINVLIRLVGGTLKLALSKNCDTRKEFQRASAQRSLRMSAVVFFVGIDGGQRVLPGGEPARSKLKDLQI